VFILAQSAAISPNAARNSLIKASKCISEKQQEKLSCLQLAMKDEVAKLGMDHVFLCDTVIKCVWPLKMNYFSELTMKHDFFRYCEYRGLLPSEGRIYVARKEIETALANQNKFSTEEALIVLESVTPGFADSNGLIVFALWRVECLEAMARARYAVETDLVSSGRDAWKPVVHMLKHNLG
jgi:hypothetical protein